jgi:hydrogenase nickel incorporation protein HypA/HybF
MHELSLCEAIAETVTRRSTGRPVSRVTVRIGHLRQVVPDSLVFSWEVLTSGTELAGSELEIEHVPATLACSGCGAVTTLDLPVMLCGSCGGADVEVLTGEELMVVSFELERV